MNQNHPKIIGANSQQAAMSAGSRQSDAPSSPISEMLLAIENALGHAHDEFGMLDNKVEPIRASAPETAKGDCSPTEVMPTQMENRLRNIYDTVCYLKRRIEATRNELRI